MNDVKGSSSLIFKFIAILFLTFSRSSLESEAIAISSTNTVKMAKLFEVVRM